MRQNIRVNAVAPGLIETPLLGSSEADFAALRPMQPGGELGRVEDVVAAVRFLAEQPFITGVVLPVGGGFSLGRW